MLVYLIYFGHQSTLFCLLGNMLIKLEVLKFQRINCSQKKAAKIQIPHTLYSTAVHTTVRYLPKPFLAL